ncbi:MAG TPA: preprotein translocase subunit SecG [Gammaproteobacteria bacterium]|jgi:preprotein translocase subunit SecG|nr:preprotein translocase subunit SecG [Gammaproteobacteria bacterium]
MQSFVLVVHVILALTVIGLVLIQHGKGADAGAAFGSGASSTVFGARGAASFLTRMTTMMAVAFFVTSLILFYMAAHRESTSNSVVEGFESPPAVEAESESNVPEPPAAPSDLPAAPSAPQADSDLPAPAPSSAE